MICDDLEQFWDEFLAYVDEGGVIPIIGPGLAVVEYQGRKVPYRQLLAQQLAERLKVSASEDADIEEVCRIWLSKRGNQQQKLYNHLTSAANALDVPIPEAYRLLAQVHDLPLIVTFCPDDLLTRAMNEERYGGQQNTLDLAFTPTECSDLPIPAEGSIVYHLFGRLSALANKYALAEEDVLEWVATLQNPAKRPSRLLTELEGKHLLFLGCSFPDWLARFILRTTRNKKFSEGRDASEYLIEAQVKEGDPFTTFLENVSCDTQILPLDPGEFVVEFERRWRERKGDAAAPAARLAPMAEAAPTGCVFISYAKEDRAAAIKVATALQAAGLPVWLDRERLDLGCDYEQKIRQAIKTSTLFVPILSATTIAGGGFFRKEWKMADSRNDDLYGATVRYLCPLSIDDAPVYTCSELPASFQACHIEKAPGGDLGEAQLKAFATAYDEMRIRLEARQ